MGVHLGGKVYFIEIDSEDNDSNYGHLYNKEGKQLSNKIFRIGGMGGKFKDGYCELLTYTKSAYKKGYGSESLWVLINEDGKIVYEAKGQFEYFYHMGGRIISENNKYIDVVTKKEICTSYSSIYSSSYIFANVYLEHKQVVYQIDKFNGDVVIHY